MPDLNKSIIQKRTDAIERFSDSILSIIEDSERYLFERMLSAFVDKLELKDGFILNTPKNKKLLQQIAGIWDDFIVQHGSVITNEILDGIDEVLDLSKQYYTGYGTKNVIDEIARSAREEVYGMLGVNENGAIVSDGYIDTLLSDKTIPAKIKNQAQRNIVGGQGITKYRNNLKTMIEGNDNKIGVLSDFYHETGQDVIAQSDRTVSIIYADGLNLKFAIYEGSLIKTSREFCIEHAGKVYHISEILLFNPITAIPPNYNPVIDLGGYRCRHHLNWISDELAVRLRPDAKEFLNQE